MLTERIERDSTSLSFCVIMRSANIILIKPISVAAKVWKPRVFEKISTHSPDKKARKSKCDYRLPQQPTPEQVVELERRVNEVIAQNLPVTYDFVPRNEVPPEVDLGKLPDDASATLRLVRIGDYDLCACVGSHVANTSEIGTFRIISHDFTPAPDGDPLGTWRLRFKLDENKTK